MTPALHHYTAPALFAHPAEPLPESPIKISPPAGSPPTATAEPAATPAQPATEPKSPAPTAPVIAELSEYPRPPHQQLRRVLRPARQPPVRPRPPPPPPPRHLRLRADGQADPGQIQGELPRPEAALWQEAKNRIARLEAFEISHALRHKNKDADALANQAMDRGMNRTPPAPNSPSPSTSKAPLKTNCHPSPSGGPARSLQSDRPPNPPSCYEASPATE